MDKLTKSEFDDAHYQMLITEANKLGKQIKYKIINKAQLPAKPKKCCGKKVKFTPKNITINCNFNYLSFIAFIYF